MVSDDILTRLADLHKQATEERSHYYTGAVIRDAIAEIERLTPEARSAEVWRIITEEGDDGHAIEIAIRAAEKDAIERAAGCAMQPGWKPSDEWRYAFGDRVRKKSGSSWHGHVRGFYSTSWTPRGYAIESEREPDSTQIYPEAALEAVIE